MSLIEKLTNATKEDVENNQPENYEEVVLEEDDEDEEEDDDDFAKSLESHFKPQKKFCDFTPQTVETIKNVAFSVTVALLMPMILPLLLEWFSMLLKTEFAASMSEVSKGWTLVTQGVAVFLGLKSNRKAAYIFMLLVPIALFVVEAALCALLMIPIW